MLYVLAYVGVSACVFLCIGVPPLVLRARNPACPLVCEKSKKSEPQTSRGLLAEEGRKYGISVCIFMYVRAGPSAMNW